MAVLTYAIGACALTPFLWGFGEGEKLMEFYDRVSERKLSGSNLAGQTPRMGSQPLPMGA